MILGIATTRKRRRSGIASTMWTRFVLLLMFVGQTECLLLNDQNGQLQESNDSDVPTTAPTVSAPPESIGTAPSWLAPENLTEQGSPSPSSFPTDRSGEPTEFLVAATLSPSKEEFTSLQFSISPSSAPVVVSTSPSPVPTSKPSPAPTRAPSVSPTLAPSVEPSDLPCKIPSGSPTSSPSAVPSNQPSSVPTLECHDQDSYKSPINDLTCEDHRGTNCVHWRILGLNTTELEELIERCPETCRIPCGSFVQFSLSLGFTIANVPGLMDADIKQDLELVTRQHLLAYMRANLDRGIPFEFDRVELVSQAVLQQESVVPEPPPRWLRSVDDDRPTTTALDVRMEFEGFTIGISQSEASKMLIAGIDSESFTIALQTTNGFFSATVISSAAEQDTPMPPLEDKEVEVLPATIVLSTLLAILVSVLFAWSWIHHRRSGKWLPRLRVFSRSEIDEDFQVHSPLRFTSGGTLAMESIPNQHSIFALPAAGSMFSFDDSRASTQQAGNLAPLIRLMASLSLSRSRSSTETEDFALPTVGSPDGDNVVSPDTESPRIVEETVEPFRPHPLSNIIPPMILIDHIDSEDTLETPMKGRSVIIQPSPQVPARIMKASKSFISVIRDADGNPGWL